MCLGLGQLLWLWAARGQTESQLWDIFPFVGSLHGLLGQHTIQFPSRVRNTGLPEG